MFGVVKRKKFVLLFLAIVLVFGIFWFLKITGVIAERTVYEALVQVADQKASNPEEDARSSLKKGDVIAIFPQGHSWSDTEKGSYLILKLKISKKETSNLTLPVFKETGGNTSGNNGQREIIRARAYRIKLESLGFDLNKLSSGQPFADKVFGGNVIEKKNPS